MRIEYVNTVTGRTGVEDLPPGLNPVRIGRHPKNHVRLDSPYIAEEAAAFDNDVVSGRGWRCWNRGGAPIKVASTVLTERDQFVPVDPPRVVVECWPFVLTVSFHPDDTAPEADDSRRLNAAGVQVVREVHRRLVDLHPDDPVDRSEWLRDDYIHRLEGEITDLASGRPEFPTNDLTHTPLGDRLAGVAVRSAVIKALVARIGNKASAEPNNDSPWTRMRIVIPEHELALGRLIDSTVADLKLTATDDLSEQTKRVDEEFWPYWARLQARRGVLTPQLCRYLAVRRLKTELKDIWFGFGPLEELLADPTVGEIMVIDADHIFIEKYGSIEASGRTFLTDPLTIIQRVMAKAGRQINTAQPLADARLADGSRVNAVIAPVALRGPALTIRRFPPAAQRLTINGLIRLGSVSTGVAAFLRAVVRNRRNVIVSGGTGTGKTTLLNALSGFIPNKERVVTVEDTAELQLQHEHVVTLQARPTNAEGAGAVTIRDLVRNALRMRPDRILVGECRGGEAIDMLQAMNTGHDGSMTTLHANSPAGVLRRLEVLVQQNAEAELPVDSIHQQVASAVDVIVQLGTVVRSGKVCKVVTEVTEVAGYDADDGVKLVPLFARTGDQPLRPTGSLPTFLPDLIAAGLVRDAIEFVQESA